MGFFLSDHSDSYPVRLGVELRGGGRIAVVVSSKFGAVNAAYCHAAVICVLAKNFKGEGKRKFTLAQKEAGLIDLQKVFQELNTLENGWGGTEVIGGSPQNQSSILDVDTVVGIMEKYIT